MACPCRATYHRRMNGPKPPHVPPTRQERPFAVDPLEDSRSRLETALLAHPYDAATRIELSDILHRQGRLRDSIQALQQAARHLPRHAPMIIQLVQRLIVRGDTLTARACLDFLAHAPDPPVDLLLIQARMRWLLGELPQAATIAGQAAGIGFDAPEDQVFYATLLTFNGRIDAAADVLERGLQRWPGHGQLLTALVQLRRQTPSSQRLDALRQYLGQNTGDSDPDATLQRAGVLHAVFKTLDDLGRHAEAWPALLECNALMHGLLSFNPDAESEIIDAFIAASRSLPQGGARDPEHEGPLPIFILGMPRSGTTLLDHMLSSHTDVVSAGEILDFWRQLHVVADIPQQGHASTMELLRRAPDLDYADLGRRYLRQTQWRAGSHPYFIDKTPINVRMVPFIRRALPRAPILHLVRDPMDVCFSNFKAMFGNASSYSYSIDALAHHYATYARITEHWRSTFPDAMLDVNYESLVRDPETGMRRILDHCGLDMQEACLRPERNAAAVATPSSVQVREPIHARSVGQWKAYAEQLEPLRRALVERGLVPA